jgi:murein DD-endopeptidase MepM/ murein hydrolase activator NlpD
LYNESGTRIADDEAGDRHWRYSATNGMTIYAGTYSSVAGSYTVTANFGTTNPPPGNGVPLNQSRYVQRYTALRTSPSFTAGYGPSLDQGNEIFVTVKYNDGWAACTYDEEVFYVDTSALSIEKVVNANRKINATGGLNLRSGRGTSFNSITLIPNGATVYVHTKYYENSDGRSWCFVTYGNSTGFVCAEYLIETSTSNGFIWPVPGYSNITSRYGNRTHPITRVVSFHSGIDIGAPTGADIVASASGRIITRTSDSLNGNYIVIQHDGGFTTTYCHLSAFVDGVNVGSNVTQGQIIGKCGSTGSSTGPHLHFTFKVNGASVNPLDYVRQP